MIWLWLGTALYLHWILHRRSRRYVVSMTERTLWHDWVKWIAFAPTPSDARWRLRGLEGQIRDAHERKSWHAN